jgi:hypothetical protein
MVKEYMNHLNNTTTKHIKNNNMLAANELRIGNLVNDNALGNNIEMDALDISVCVDNPERYEPIPLTAEILEKCGFVKEILEMSGCSVFTKGNSWKIAHKYRDGDNEFHLWHTQVSPPTWSLLQVSHLHTFQNLYFSLTGAEINYTP